MPEEFTATDARKLTSESLEKKETECQENKKKKEIKWQEYEKSWARFKKKPFSDEEFVKFLLEWFWLPEIIRVTKTGGAVVDLNKEVNTDKQLELAAKLFKELGFNVETHSGSYVECGDGGEFEGEIAYHNLKIRW